MTTEAGVSMATATKAPTDNNPFVSNQLLKLQFYTFNKWNSDPMRFNDVIFEHSAEYFALVDIVSTGREWTASETNVGRCDKHSKQHLKQLSHQ